ncbi:protein of unknown function [Hyphomicrobium sp. MC1]|nr:protein of unknown function [Hyphomicrobium sp. MC1]
MSICLEIKHIGAAAKANLKAPCKKQKQIEHQMRNYLNTLRHDVSSGIICGSYNALSFART